ncbi:MAG: hypothetical protein ABJA35_07485 [Parafilimonas sp.]
MKKILMASFAMTVFAATALLFQLTSCKKVVGQIEHNCPDPIYPVEGLYVGTYSVTQQEQQGNLYYSFVVFPGGDLLTKSVIGTGDTTYQKGTWELAPDSTFTGTIATFTTPSVIQGITGKFSKDGKISDATWHDIYNPFGSSLSGNFSVMQRVN